MFENQQLILKWCCSFPPPTLSGLPQQAFIFTLEALLHALKPLQPRSNFSFPTASHRAGDGRSLRHHPDPLSSGWISAQIKAEPRHPPLAANHVQAYPGRSQQSGDFSLPGSEHRQNVFKPEKRGLAVAAASVGSPVGTANPEGWGSHQCLGGCQGKDSQPPPLPDRS